MNARRAAENLEVIRTLMERTMQYQLLTARAGLAAGTLAAAGALAFVLLDPADPLQFGLVWAGVFVGALAATAISTVWRGRERGEHVWSRQTRAVVTALLPGLVAAAALTGFFFIRGEHLQLPGIWMLCYGQAALATHTYAPAAIRWLGIGFLPAGILTLAIGPAWGIWMMGLVFGLGHIILGVVLLASERREQAIKLHRSVA